MNDRRDAPVERYGPRRLIGGLFGLEISSTLASSAPPAFLDAAHLFTVNAASALAIALGRIAPRILWLPSYLCAGSIRKAVRVARCSIRFYDVGETLQPVSLEWLGDVISRDAVLLISYFGFAPAPRFIDAVRSSGATIIEDAAQALLSDGTGAFGDVVLFSPRKFVGVPDGGILVSKAFAANERLVPPPAAWWLRALEATLARARFDSYGVDRSWFALFRESEATAPVGTYAISELSKLLLVSSFDYVEIAERRRRNYDVLAAEIGGLAVFPERPKAVVPLGFPIVLRDRNRVREALFSEHIYPPVHWELDDFVPVDFAESHALSRSTMTLPCDQRYDERDMLRVAATVRRAMRTAG